MVREINRALEIWGGGRVSYAVGQGIGPLSSAVGGNEESGEQARHKLVEHRHWGLMCTDLAWEGDTSRHLTFPLPTPSVFCIIGSVSQDEVTHTFLSMIRRKGRT